LYISLSHSHIGVNRFFYIFFKKHHLTTKKNRDRVMYNEKRANEKNSDEKK